MNWQHIFTVIYIIQLFNIVVLVFSEEKDPVTTQAWILVLVFFPIIGFLLYLFLGRGLSKMVIKKKNYTKNKKLQFEHDDESPYERKYYSKTLKIALNNEDPEAQGAIEYKNLIKLNYNLCLGAYSDNNNMTVFTHARAKYDKLFEDIRAAKNHIHIAYFIISNTKISHELIALLAEKAKEGIEVILIYDAIGNLGMRNKSLFKPLKDAGGNVCTFFPLRQIFFANYRSHHKLVVIDGEIGYTGGMNIGDEYMGLNPKHSPWRDTHLRLTGDCVHSIQLLFLIDLRYNLPNKKPLSKAEIQRYFPPSIDTGVISMQVIHSGPDDKSESIKRSLIYMINSAKKRIYIQTPYLIPDAQMIEALQNAAMSGVEVIIMIPGIPDKLSVYYVTTSYIQMMLDYDVKIYTYNGFIHSKAMVVDDKILTIGTTNLDMRSFKLHFEDNVVIYDEQEAKKYSEIFEQDMLESLQMTEERHSERGLLQKFFEKLLRLFAPLM